jgi:hypothetical protein
MKAKATLPRSPADQERVLMAKAEILRPYVEKLLKELVGTEELIVDQDGDVPIRWGSAMMYVRMLDRPVPLVRVFSPIVRKVKKSAKLLEYINDLNCQIDLACVQLLDGDVVATADLVAESLDKFELDQVCQQIGWLADTYDNQLHDQFGGEMMFSDDGSSPAEDEVDT